MRWIAGIAAVILVLGASIWTFRSDILLQVVKWRTAQQVPVGPTQDVAWQGAPLDNLQAPRDGGPPNIVLIVADDLGWNDLSINGGLAGGTVLTPAIDAIGTQGAVFRNGYSANGTCAPSRASLMSGRYSTRFGFEFTPTPPGMLQVLPFLEQQPGAPEAFTYPPEADALEYWEMGIPSSEITVAEILRDQGYYTAHVGKWHLGRTEGSWPQDQGFDDSLLTHSGLYLPEHHPDTVNSYQDFDPIDRFLWARMQFAASFNGGESFAPPEYITDYYTEEAVNIIEQNRHRPFFLYLAHWAPHTPLQALRADYEALSHIEDHRERVYAAMVRALDRSVAEVVATLEENGIADNTLIIFTSDNGGAGYVGLPEVNAPFRGWKITFFEGGIHVPFMMRWPGVIDPGTEVSDPVHHTDVFATAVGAAGGAVPTDRIMDGTNLLPYAIDPALQPAPPHERLFWRQGLYQVILEDGWKLQVDGRSDQTWLFNLNDDPTEQNNLADQYPDRVADMLVRLREHDAQLAEPLWDALIEAPINVDRTVAEPWQEDDEYIYWPN